MRVEWQLCHRIAQSGKYHSSRPGDGRKSSVTAPTRGNIICHRYVWREVIKRSVAYIIASWRGAIHRMYGVNITLL